MDWDRLQNDELAVDAERLARAASSAGCGLWELDLTTGAAWVTEETRRIYGLRLAEPFSWEAFVRLLHPEDKDEVVTKVKAVMASGSVFNERHRILLPNGTVRWVHVTARQDGPHRLLGASIDETERVEAERLAKEHESRVLMAAAAAGLGFSEWTTSRGRICIDARFQELLGIAPGELDNTYALWLSRIHDEDRARLEDASRRLRSAEADHLVMEYRYLHPQRGDRLPRSDRAERRGLDDRGPRGRHREEAPRGTPAAAQRSARAGKRDAQGRGEAAPHSRADRR